MEEQRTEKNPSGWKADLLVVFKGMLMGAADSVPGVSGGTIALVVGIYEQLVTAISHVDGTLFALLRKREWSAVAQHLDLRFLIALGIGIVLGFLSLISLMHHLLEHYGEQTRAVFFGLVFASTVLVVKLISRWSIFSHMLAVTGIVFAYWIAGLSSFAASDEYWYFFICGVIAICAMILPGISGSFLLVLLGKYKYISGLIKNALFHQDFTSTGILQLVCFGAGCLVGLLSFSKLLRYCLANHKDPTMALMCGIMLGALRALWPFQEEVMIHQHQFSVNTWPEDVSSVVIALALGIVAALFIFALEYVSSVKLPRNNTSEGT